QGGRHPAVTPYGRYVQVYRSPDLLHWSKTLTMSFAREGQMRPPTTDPRTQPEDIEQTHTGIAAWNRGNVLIGLTGYWHAATDQRYGTYGKRPWKRHGGIGLLVLERDRFGSLSVIDPAEPGLLVSSDLATDGPVRLWVNAAGLGPSSILRLELLDAQERPLPG